MKSSSAGSAHWRSSKISRAGAHSETCSEKARQAAKSSSRSNAACEPGLSSAARRGSLRALAEPGAATHHLGEGCERDALAVRGGPANVQGDASGQGVKVALELPDQAALADASDAQPRDDPTAARRDGALVEVNELS